MILPPRQTLYSRGWNKADEGGRELLSCRMLPNKKTSSVPVLVSGDATAAASLSARSAAPPLCSVRPQLLSDGGKLLHKAPSMSSAATRLKGQFPLKNVKAMQHRDKDREYWPDVCWGVTQEKTEPNYRAGNNTVYVLLLWCETINQSQLSRVFAQKHFRKPCTCHDSR